MSEDNKREWKDPAVKVQELFYNFKETLSEKSLDEFKEKSVGFMKNKFPSFRKRFPLWWLELLVIGVLILVFIFMFQLERSYQASHTRGYCENMESGIRSATQKYVGTEVMTDQDLTMLMRDIMEYHPGGDASFWLQFSTQSGIRKVSSYDRNLMVSCDVPDGSVVEDVYFCLDEYFDEYEVKHYLDLCENYTIVSSVEGYVTWSDKFIPTKVVFEHADTQITETIEVGNEAATAGMDAYDLLTIVNIESDASPYVSQYTIENMEDVQEAEGILLANCYVDVYNTDSKQNAAAKLVFMETVNRIGDLSDYVYAKGGFATSGSFIAADECSVEFHGGGVYGMAVMTFPLNKMALSSAALWSRMLCMIVVLQGGAIIGFYLRRRWKKQKADMDYMRNTFINAMAHEMKTPAAVIKNSTECILADINPEKNRHYVEMIAKETDHMSELVSRMLLYTRTSEGVFKLTKIPVSLPDLVHTVSEAHQVLMEERGLTIKVLNLGVDQTFAEPDLLKMAIDNFISNAVRYAKEKTEITIGLCGTRFTIHNQCDALTEEQLERIWEPLYVIDAARSETDGSAGMGLAICKNILELHNAEYGVENVDDGVRFYFTLT